MVKNVFTGKKTSVTSEESGQDGSPSWKVIGFGYISDTAEGSRRTEPQPPLTGWEVPSLEITDSRHIAQYC